MNAIEKIELSNVVLNPSDDKPKSFWDKVQSKVTSVAKGILSTGKKMAGGALIYTPIQAVMSGGMSLKIFYGSLFNREMFGSNPVAFQEILTKLGILHKNAGHTIPDNFDPSAVFFAKCPKEEYYNQYHILSGIKISKSQEVTLALRMVAASAIVEEAVFRYGMQELLLKRLVKKVISKIAPQYLDAVDSKVYTACRILLTSVAFSAYHLQNYAIMPDAYVRAQLVQTFVMGLAFGVLQEKYGLASAIGAHAMNNTVAVLPGMLTKC